MIVVACDAPTGLHCYGPFKDADEVQCWLRHRFSVFRPPGRLVSMTLISEYERSDPVESARCTSRLYQTGHDHDSVDAEFVLMLVGDASIGIGPFPSRVHAEAWYLRELESLYAHPGVVAPILPA